MALKLSAGAEAAAHYRAALDLSGNDDPARGGLWSGLGEAAELTGDEAAAAAAFAAAQDWHRERGEAAAARTAGRRLGLAHWRREEGRAARTAFEDALRLTGPDDPGERVRLVESQTLGEALMTPTKLYVKSALAAIRSGHVNGLAHITGGGITENLPRCLPEGLDAEIDLETWTPPAVFGWLANSAGIAQAEMLRTFNCGIGLVAVTDMMSSGHVIDAFQESGDKAMRIGTLVKGEGEPRCVYRGSLKL